MKGGVRQQAYLLAAPVESNDPFRNEGGITGYELAGASAGRVQEAKAVLPAGTVASRTRPCCRLLCCQHKAVLRPDVCRATVPAGGKRMKANVAPGGRPHEADVGLELVRLGPWRG
jgi:hypothetical protein